MRVIFCQDPEDMAHQGADYIAELAAQATTERGRCTIALTGGSTPAHLYTLLASAEQATPVDWSHVFWFMGDERVVPPDDERSNYGMVQRTLLSPGSWVPEANVFPVSTEGKSPHEAAEAYGETLAGFFQIPPDGPPPVFDVILLGMGEDGHIASLFPGMPSLAVTDKWVVSSPPGTLPPPVERVTLTFPVLNAARQVVFLVAGEKKADTVKDILENQPAPEQRPAAGIEAANITYLLDEAAAAKLKARSLPIKQQEAGGKQKRLRVVPHRHR